MTTTLLKKALSDYLDNNTVTISDKEQIEAFIKDCDDIERKAGISEYCSVTFANSMQQLTGLFTEDASTDWDKRMIKESREVMSMLEYCMNEPDADISISVKHKNGKHATANLYDQAALVQELYSALKYFIKEMQ